MEDFEDDSLFKFNEAECFYFGIRVYTTIQEHLMWRRGMVEGLYSCRSWPSSRHLFELPAVRIRLSPFSSVSPKA